MSAARLLMLILLWASISSVLCGIADLDYLGPYYVAQSPIFPIYQIFGVTSTSYAGEVITPGWTKITSVMGAFISALFFEYSVLTHSEFGNFIRMVIILPIAGALIFAFSLMVWTHVPFLGRGSQ